MELDRLYQREFLNDLAKLYPGYGNVRAEMTSDNKESFLRNIFYLREHGLVRFDDIALQSGTYVVNSVQITAKGMDFIADDGGLSSVLGVVTIKLHEDTIKDLLVTKIQSSSQPDTVKKKLINQIKQMPADVLKSVSQKAIEYGLEKIPDVAHWLAIVADLST